MGEKIDIKLMFSPDGKNFIELKEANGLDANRIVQQSQQDDLKVLEWMGK